MEYILVYVCVIYFLYFVYSCKCYLNNAFNLNKNTILDQFLVWLMFGLGYIMDILDHDAIFYRQQRAATTYNSGYLQQ